MSVPLSMPRSMFCNDLVGDVVEIFSDVLRLGCGIQDIVVDLFDQSGFPSGRLAPMVSQVWQATMHISEGAAPSARVTSA